MQSGTTLGALVDQYLGERRARGELTSMSVQNYRGHLYGFARSFGNRPLSQLGRRSVETWIETIGQRAPATRRTQLSTVRGFCMWLQLHKRIAADPTLGLPRIPQPRLQGRAFGTDQVAALLVRGCPDARARAIVMMKVGMGLRCCEVARASTGDYDEGAGTLHVHGKGGHQRILPVPSEVAAAISSYWVAEGRVGGALIRNRTTGGHIAAKTVSSYLRQWLYGCGVKEVALDGRNAHALRHTAASDVLRNVNGPNGIFVVQEMLGHARIDTTVRYLRRVGLDDLREAMEGRDYGESA